MEVIRDPWRFQAWCAAQAELGFVPTMGALHAGHLALVRASRTRDRLSAVSVFVNPTQFGPSEDFTRYPRSLDQDCALLEAERVAAVFAPEAETMYPAGAATAVEVEGLSDRLCGASRPGHFRGVATVVLKLFELARPARAYFGQKDAAQVAVVRRMVRDLLLPIEIVVCPIARDSDGLALSSRNLLLAPEDRVAALALSRGLRSIAAAHEAGERDAAALLRLGRAEITREPRLRLDYFSAVDENTLLPVARAAPATLFAVAAFAGQTRLIDNGHIDVTGHFVL